MNKFKFGDRVRLIGSIAEFLVIGENDVDVAVAVVLEFNEPNILKNDLKPKLIAKRLVELIPHPDTARLDYVINNTSSYQKRQIVGNRYQEQMPSDFRQAIDNAMQSEPKKE